MKLLFTICLFVALRSPVSGINEPMVIDSLLAIGADITETYEIRVGAIKKAVTMDETGRSHAAHARLLMRFPSPERMVAAERAAKRAIRKEKHNADLIGLLSKLYWRIGRRGTSLEYAERAIEANAINPIGHFWAGRYHFWETMKYLWMNRVEVNQDTDGRVRSHNIDLGRWGEDSRKKAESAFITSLNLDPYHDEARRYLGLIYYQTQRAIELRDLYNPVIKNQPNTPTGYFKVGMSYHLERDYERAYQAYSKGLKKMSEGEQRFMLAVFTDEQTDTLATVPDMQTLQRFWTGKNPFFLSPVNERMLEQCRRVAYANLRFGEPEKEIAGWTTDRGQAYIRYGDPLALQSRPADVNTQVDDPIIMQKLRFHETASFGKSSDQYEFGKELWEYENFILVFDNTDTRGAWKFRIASLDGASVGLKDLVERVPTRFVDPFGDRRFEMPYQVAQFRGEKGNSRVELYYAVPTSKVEVTTSKALGTVELNKGLFLFDSNWDTLNVQKTQVKRLAWVRDNGRSGHLLSREILNVAPRKYNIAVEVLDQKTKSVGGLRFAIPVRTFSRTELEISSILLARRVIAKPERPFGRDRFVILANPMKATSRNKKAYFYFEVYNLKRDAFGRTNYQITYQTKLIATGEFNTQPDWVTAVTQEVTGDHPWEPVYLALGLENAAPGLQDFRVIVQDKLSSQEASAATQYRIRW